MVEVVAALIWQEDRLLICQRPAHKTNALLWEFVGGKVEPGESHAVALIRECREELDMTVAVGDAFLDLCHTYPDITIHLTLYHATIREGEPRLLEHNALAWVTPAQLEDYPFCPADREILEKIRATYG